MSVMINEVLLLGTIARDPEVSFSDSGTPVARTTLCLAEEREGQTYTTFVPLEGFGKSAETLGELSPGALVLIKGKLRWKGLGMKDGKKVGQLEVFCWSVQRLALAAEVPV